MSAIWVFRRRRWAKLLAVFVAAAVASLSYQTFVLLIMATVVTSIMLAALRDGDGLERTVVRMIAPSLACALGAAAGLATAFSLNFMAFGHFGLVIEPWRIGGVGYQNRNRAFIALHNMASTGWFLTRQTFGVAPALLAVTLGALGLSARGAPRDEARTRLFAVFVLLATCGATWLVVFLTRAPTGPERSGTLVWFAIIGGALACSASRSRPIVTYGSLAVLLITGVATGAAPFARLGVIQEANDRVMARLSADLAQEEKSPVHAAYVVGAPSVLQRDEDAPMPEMWVTNLLNRAAVRKPLRVRPIYCHGTYNAGVCDAVAQPDVRDAIARMPSYPAAGYLARSGDLIIVKLGPVD
jgi:hypothetical protein